ncbi:hypothetical protein LOC68_01860 [Blastopirellula sp. JC732]|uniref:Peptidylprolyl isomerase n=1 Tax=Blastopirellula sediminis TaxID=2894196 RepID=A0A9X1MI01_9BACT|nr:hypothetical protein [Blastopirellula sediminis]MCC9608066.1 hypothetical protein [Blastopirellula sediminis]MCC9627141.1 hypothetical protein [Blastopirellula sediminis]
MKTCLLLTLCLLSLVSAVQADEKEDLVAAEKAQMRKTYLPVLQVELSNLQRICQLSPAELEQAIQAGKEAMNDQIDKHEFAPGRAVARNVGVENGGMMVLAGRARQQPLSRDSLEHAIRQRLLPLLNAEQKNRYEEELQRQSDFARDAVVEHLVVVLENRLGLSAAQREEVTTGLKEYWKADWEQQLQVLNNYDHYIPTVPGQAVVPHLDKKQQLIFQGMRQVSFSAARPFGGAIVIDDIDLGEE